MVDYCIAELKYKAQLFKDIGGVSVFDGDVVKSDVVVPDSLREELKGAVNALEDVPEFQKDWHPASDGKVLDLVHPSLFPAIYGRTRILPDQLITLEDCVERAGEGTTLLAPPRYTFDSFLDREYSHNFQWLPCDLNISGNDCPRCEIC
jgi:hypothetical protein